MKPQFLHATYGILNKGMRLFVARIVYSTKEVKDSMFKKDGFTLYHKNGELKIRMPHKLYQGRRLRRFLRDFVKTRGGIPRSISMHASHFKKSNPKLVLNGLCLCLDSACDALEKSQKFVEDVSPTMTQEISILIGTLSTLSDNVKIAVNEKKYEEAFKHVRKARRQVNGFIKENDKIFQVFMEVSRKRLEDMFT